MENTEFRCCTKDEGCGAICDCPYDLADLFSHLTPGETQTVVCDKTGDMVCIHRVLLTPPDFDCKGYYDSPIRRGQSYE